MTASVTFKPVDFALLSDVREHFRKEAPDSLPLQVRATRAAFLEYGQNRHIDFKYCADIRTLSILRHDDGEELMRLAFL
jgi:hypothetical protein